MIELMLLIISGVVFIRLYNGQRNERTWNWISLYWAVLCMKNAMEVLHD